MFGPLTRPSNGTTGPDCGDSLMESVVQISSEQIPCNVLFNSTPTLLYYTILFTTFYYPFVSLSFLNFTGCCLVVSNGPPLASSVAIVIIFNLY